MTKKSTVFYTTQQELGHTKVLRNWDTLRSYGPLEPWIPSSIDIKVLRT